MSDLKKQAMDLAVPMIAKFEGCRLHVLPESVSSSLSSVPRLLGPGRPRHVPWEVAPFVIDSFQGVLSPWTRADMVQERAEAVGTVPLICYADTTPAVVVESGVVGISATGSHSDPCVEFRCVSRPVRLAQFPNPPGGLAHEAAATCGASFAQLGPARGLGATAVTGTRPPSLSRRGVFRTVQDNQTPKTLPCQIDKAVVRHAGAYE